MNHRIPHGDVLDAVAKAKMRDTRFAIPPLTQVQRVLQINIRGGRVKIKPEGGKFKVPENPGSIGYVLFLQAGSPVALALMMKCEKVTMGDFEIEYSKPKWLRDQ